MSQYPSPYQPPDPYAQQWAQYYGQTSCDQALKPARRASVMMFIVGPLFLLCGTCTLLGGLMPNDPEATTEAMSQLGRLFGGMQMPAPEQLPSRAESLVTGILQFLSALALLVLGVPVRRGGRQATVGAIFATSVLVLVMAASQLLSAARLGAPMVAGAVCVLIPVSVPFVLLLVWLVQALRIAPMAEQWSAYQQQYQQYMQSQMYAQGPYGQQPGVPAPPPGQAPVQDYAPPPPPPPDRDVP